MIDEHSIFYMKYLNDFINIKYVLLYLKQLHRIFSPITKSHASCSVSILLKRSELSVRDKNYIRISTKQVTKILIVDI
jgi:hypothetical protein